MIKKLCALFAGLLFSVALAAEPMEYKVELTKDTVTIKEVKGTVLVLPRTEIAVVKDGGENVYAMIVLINESPMGLAVLDSQCKDGKGQIAVLDAGLNAVLMMVTFDYSLTHKSPAFVAKYMCDLGQKKMAPTSKVPVKPTKGYISLDR